MKTKKLWAILLIVTLLLSGCGKPAEETKETANSEPNESNMVRLTMRVPENLNPITAPWESCKNVFLLVYDGLFYESDSMEAAPCLAESYSVLSEGLEVMVNLRTDVKWQDGKPFIADDVIYTLDEIRNTENAAFAQNISSLASWSKVDDHTVVLFLTEPYEAVVHELTFPIIPAHFHDYEHTAVGTGPFCVETYDATAAMTLAANPDYFRGAPKLSGAIVQFVRTDDMTTAAFTAHSSDVISAERQENTSFSQDEKMNYVAFPSTQLIYLGMNMQKQMFSSALTRQALSSLVDRDAIVSQDYRDRAVAASSVLHPEYAYYNPEISDVTYRVDDAREKLFTAGWSDLDGDGIIDLSSGGEESVEIGELTPFVCTILVNEEDLLRILVAQRLVKAMAEVGISATVESTDFESYIQRIEAGDYDMYLGKIQFPSALEVSSLIGSGGSANNSGYMSETLDAMITAMAMASDELAVKVSTEEFQTRFAEECPIIPICFLDSGWYVWSNLNFHAEGYQNPFSCAHLWAMNEAGSEE